MTNRVITMRATDNTPETYRRYDGRTVEVPPNKPVPVNFVGQIYGVPGILRGDEFEITAPHPVPVDPGPPWAQALAAQLAEIKRMLTDRPES